MPTGSPRRYMENEPRKRGREKKARVYPAFSLLQIYQLRKAIFWSDEWGAPQRLGFRLAEHLRFSPLKILQYHCPTPSRLLNPTINGGWRETFKNAVRNLRLDNRVWVNLRNHIVSPSIVWLPRFFSRGIPPRVPFFFPETARQSSPFLSLADSHSFAQVRAT